MLTTLKGAINGDDISFVGVFKCHEEQNFGKTTLNGALKENEN